MDVEYFSLDNAIVLRNQTQSSRGQRGRCEYRIAIAAKDLKADLRNIPVPQEETSDAHGGCGERIKEDTSAHAATTLINQ